MWNLHLCELLCAALFISFVACEDYDENVEDNDWLELTKYEPQVSRKDIIHFDHPEHPNLQCAKIYNQKNTGEIFWDDLRRYDDPCENMYARCSDPNVAHDSPGELENIEIKDNVACVMDEDENDNISVCILGECVYALIVG